MGLERTIQSILDQQAEFASDIQAMKEMIKDIINARQGQFNQVGALMLELATSQERTNEIVAALAQRVVDLSDLMERHIAGHDNQAHLVKNLPRIEADIEMI
jgi:hypothetical protein